jgi:hypothetical protein
MEMLHVPRIWQWCSILHSQVDTSRSANLCHPKKMLPTGGELVCTFTGKYASEQQIIHLELPSVHKLLVIAPKRLAVPCISEHLKDRRRRPGGVNGSQSKFLERTWPDTKLEKPAATADNRSRRTTQRKIAQTKIGSSRSGEAKRKTEHHK